jgi:hypothetical protein
MIRNRILHSVETEKYNLKIYDNHFIECVYNAGVTIDVEDCVSLRNEVLKHYTDKKFLVLVQGLEFFTVTRSARELSATEQYSSHMLAIAFHTNSSLLMVLAEAYTKITQPYVPTKFFRDPDAAHEWLLEQRGL